ncbi:hypothetical protein B0H16DRAFT_1886178 [Mycena metata]|uniref:F-box domain-containing protein n=1 Tax=Mycena metata TaxID=1033252 RepID=A0AAD7J2T4_9AGAR|nr:hypothetical protein B0H16DRAFT_1886178 [Mycena metata]
MPTIDLRRRLVELDAQILEQKGVLRDLQQTRIDVEREINETATYPILTTALASLIAVCWTWRGIALSTPTLWSTMDISFDDIPSTVIAKPELVESSINQWLGRSGECPLSLTFCLRLTEDDDYFSISRLRPIVRQYAHRIQHLDLDLGDHNPMEPLELHSLSFPLLQVAKVQCDFGSESHVFNNAPLLHSLHVGGNQGVVATRFHLRWEQLTRFVGSIDNLDLFIVARNLIEVKCYWTGEDITLGVITHSRITSFTILYAEDDRILQYLTLPSLHNLDLSDPTDDLLESFLERSSPPLISLRAQVANSSFARWHEALVHVAATLENIEISCASQEDMTSILSWAWGSSPAQTFDALSNLKTLHCLDVLGPVDHSDLVDFLYFRARKLRSFQLVWRTSPFLDGHVYTGPPGAPAVDSIYGHFSTLRAAGMNIYVGTEDENYAAKKDDASDT